MKPQTIINKRGFWNFTAGGAGRRLIFLFLFCLTISVTAQEEDADEIIRVETELVPFEVTVTDRDGKPVRGLEAKDFKLYEDGVERPIDFFEAIKKEDGRPLSIVFALDVSGSVTREELTRLRDALRIFIQKLADYDSYFALMTFGMEVKTLQSFTNRPDRLEKVLRNFFVSRTDFPRTLTTRLTTRFGC